MNLDCTDSDELRLRVKKARAIARLLRLRHPGNRRAGRARRRLGLWARYGETLLCARLARLTGNIVRALQLETRCDVLYARMPSGMRW